jgi:DNA mismatch repair ATPase MutS
MSGIELRNKYVRKINKKISQVANGIVILSQIDKKLKIKNLRGGASATDKIPSNMFLVANEQDTKVNFDELKTAIDTATEYTWISTSQWKNLVDKINELKTSHANLKDKLPQTEVIKNLTAQITTLQEYIDELQKIIANKSNPINVDVANLIAELEQSISSNNNVDGAAVVPSGPSQDGVNQE